VVTLFKKKFISHYHMARHHHHPHKSRHHGHQHHHEHLYKHVLVVGGYGHLGSKITSALLAYGEKVSMLVRKESLDSPIIEILTKEGAGVVEGDLSKPETLVGALKGFDAVISVNGDPSLELNLIAAIKQSPEVQRYFPSIWSSKLVASGKCPDNVAIDAKNKAYEAAKELKCGVTTVFIGCFMDSLGFLGIDVLNGQVTVFDGNRPIGYIHTDEVADLIPLILNDKSAIGAEMYFDTEKTSTNQIIQLIEKHNGGKKVTITNVSEQQLDEKIKANMTPTFNFMPVLQAQFQKQWFFSDKMQFQSELARRYPEFKVLKTCEQYVADLLAGKEHEIYSK